MDSIFLQKQVRENAQDLQGFYKELNEWGEMIKKREEWEKKKPQRRRISSAELAASEERFSEQVKDILDASSSSSLETFPKVLKDDPARKKSKHIRGTDYAAWDKFDADKYCEKFDKMDAGEEVSDLESDEGEEVNARLMELADADKDKGNRYVKQGNWDEAIRCYTQAIDSYPYNAIYYANRGLCYLKTNSYRLAETDCTTALQIDKTYVKAYLRRAAAREGLRNFADAEADLHKLFQYEPNNTEAHAILRRVERALVSKVTQQKPEQKAAVSAERKIPILTEVVERRQPIEVDLTRPKKEIEKMDVDPSGTDDCFEGKCPPEDVFAYGPGGDKVIRLQTVRKCPRTRSKRPLRRIRIENVNFKSEQMLLYKVKIDNQDMEPITKPEEMEITSKYSLNELLNTKINKESENLSKLLRLNDPPENEKKVQMPNEVPKTSLQFYQVWNSFNDLVDKYKYLKALNPSSIYDIFKYNMDSNTFGEILEILFEYFVPNNDNYYEFLMELAEVNRFSALLMFMTPKDQQCLLKLVEAMEKNNKYTPDNVLDVKTVYELLN